MKLNKEQRAELEKLQKEIVDEAKSVIEDYAKETNELTGSVIHIHEDSPYLDEKFTGKSWKKVIKVNDSKEVFDFMEKHNKKVREKKKRD